MTSQTSTNDTPNMPAGWYHAEGDPAGTQRYWDGSGWQGEPQTVSGGGGIGGQAVAGMSSVAAGAGVTAARAESPIGYFKSVLFENYANFDGRARRAEYWWFTLILAIAAGVLALLTGLLGAVNEAFAVIGVILLGVLFLATIVPSIAVTVRRLHDTGRSGWWYLLTLVPGLSLIVLVFTFLDSDRGPNQYGVSPKYGGGSL